MFYNRRISKKEIGSEFWDVPIAKRDNGIFNNNIKWFICGTEALEYILNDILFNNIINNALIPSWCCESLILPFKKRKINTDFYEIIIENGSFSCNISNIEKYDVILIMDFFGFTDHVFVSNFDGVIIRDVTHSIFSKDYSDADYYFGSLRKWAGFFTGGFAMSNHWNRNVEIPDIDEEYIRLRQNAMDLKRDYIEGKILEKDFLNVFHKLENYLDNVAIMGSCDRDIYYAKHFDIRKMKRRRRRNALFLQKKLNKCALFKNMKKNECPLFFPIIVSNGQRDGLKHLLIENSIYCPVHWQLTANHKTLTDDELLLYKNELSIVCDQRYRINDMKKIVKLITKYFKERETDNA